MGKIGWTDRVMNEVSDRVKGERNVVCTINRRTANWIGHVRRNCLVKYVSVGEVKGGI